MAETILKTARTAAGSAIRVEGRGTAKVSASSKLFIEQVLSQPGATASIDLSACEHLDSTFLGLLLKLQKQYSPARVKISAPQPLVDKCFAPLGLSRIVSMTTEPPQVVGEWSVVEAASPIDQNALGHHMMETHRQLADEVNGPHQAAFASIANQLERELSRKQSPT